MLPGPRVIRKECNPLPVGVGANPQRWLPHLTGQVQPGPSSESLQVHQPSEITRPNTTFLDFGPWVIYFGEGWRVGSTGMPLRNSLSQDQGKTVISSQRGLAPGNHGPYWLLLMGEIFFFFFGMYRDCHSPRIMHVVINILDMLTYLKKL